MPGVEVVAAPTLNQALVRFVHPDEQASASQHDSWTDQMIEAINREGTAFFSGSLWQGRRVMRISVVNWRTDDNNVRKTLAAAARIIEIERLNVVSNITMGANI